MPDWKDRLTQQLEPLLKQPDPRQQISAYHDMPYAIFRYPPEEEFAVRQQVSLLRTRLEQIGKRVTTISLAECLNEALEAEGMGPEALVDAEKSVGLEATVETIFQILSEYQPLDELVARRIPKDADPQRDVQCQRTGGNDVNFGPSLLAQLHYRAVPETALDLRQRRVQRLLALAFRHAP